MRITKQLRVLTMAAEFLDEVSCVMPHLWLQVAELLGVRDAVRGQQRGRNLWIREGDADRLLRKDFFRRRSTPYEMLSATVDVTDIAVNPKRRHEDSAVFEATTSIFSAINKALEVPRLQRFWPTKRGSYLVRTFESYRLVHNASEGPVRLLSGKGQPPRYVIDAWTSEAVVSPTEDAP